MRYTFHVTANYPNLYLNSTSKWLHFSHIQFFLFVKNYGISQKCFHFGFKLVFLCCWYNDSLKPNENAILLCFSSQSSIIRKIVNNSVQFSLTSSHAPSYLLSLPLSYTSCNLNAFSVNISDYIYLSLYWWHLLTHARSLSQFTISIK